MRWLEFTHISEKGDKSKTICDDLIFFDRKFDQHNIYINSYIKVVHTVFFFFFQNTQIEQLSYFDKKKQSYEAFICINLYYN